YKLDDPNKNLGLLMDNLKMSRDKDGNPHFDLPNVDSDGVIVEYFFGKKDENGNDIILHPKIGKTEQCLRDYNVKTGETLDVIMDPVAG
ncbi:hypothetical protein LJC67_07245, partial [Bacteroidales bacterium OttesenSCG-928-A14]|nr:hypothetical protein [Bacteroidales bacterium OttesenSCG-928-A14]